MLGELKETWHRLKQAPPGRRFQQYNKEHQAKRRSQTSKVLSVGAGIAIVLVGIVALPAPGPGMLVIIIGAALISRESVIMARALDWTELRLRAALAWLRSTWRRASLFEKVAACLLGAAITGTAAVLVYRVAFRA